MKFPKKKKKEKKKNCSKNMFIVGNSTTIALNKIPMLYIYPSKNVNLYVNSRCYEITPLNHIAIIFGEIIGSH